MNSISANLNAESIAATARMLRSAKKEVILIVEGDEDIALFANSLGLPRSNFISCFGKERLMEVFDLVPKRGIDEGVIFLRDRDCDDVKSHRKSGVLIVVSDQYDFEMSLLPKRVFSRIFNEFVKTKGSSEFAEASFRKLATASAHVGALRLISHADKLEIDFKDAKTAFIDASNLSVDAQKMVRYFLARSELSLRQQDDLTGRVLAVLSQIVDPASLSSGKDFLNILGMALSRHFKCCQASECAFETLSRMFRMTVTHDDVKELPLYPLFVEQVQGSGMEWRGHSL